MPVSRDAVIWGYRLILGREVESEAAIATKMTLRDNLHLLQVLVYSEEFNKSGRKGLLFAPENVVTPANHYSAEEVGLKRIKISDLPLRCFKNEAAKTISGTLLFPIADETKLNAISISFFGNQNPSSLVGVEIILRSIPQLFIDISHSHQKVTFGKKCAGAWIFHLWGECSATISDEVTSNGVDCFINPGGELFVGRDCMFANAFLHVGDNHAVFDLDSGIPLNNSKNPKITFKDHVWIASRATVLADTTIGSGSVLGAGAVVKGTFPDYSLVTGVPGKVSKNGISWTRSGSGHEAKEVTEMLHKLRGQ